jgi:hypothetical protein
MRPLLVALSVATFAVVACQPSQTGSDAAATFCGDLRALNRSAAALDVTTGAATVGEFQQRMKAVDDTWNDLKESAKAVPQARVNDLETAYNDLKQTISSLPNDATLAQAAQTVQPKVVAVRQARQQLGSGVRCPGT